MDEIYIERYGCVMPFHDSRPLEKQCLPNNTMRNEYWELLRNDIFKTHCQLPCASMDVTFPTPSYDSGPLTEAYVKLYLLSTVKVQTSFWSYSIITLLAEVGGYVGLLLGISLLDFNKVLHWIYNIYIQRFD